MQSKREFLSGMGLGIAAAAAALPAWAQGERAGQALAPRRAGLPNRTAKTTDLFKSPGRWPNALGASPRGLWIGEQHLPPREAASVNLPYPTHPGKEQAWLVDKSGKILMQRESNSLNTTGITEGNGRIWVAANVDTPETGIHEIDLASGRQVAQHQIPLSPNNISGQIRGMQWHNGKLWVANGRIDGLMRINTANWTPELILPVALPRDMSRHHGFTFDKDGSILVAIAKSDSTGYANTKAGLLRLEAETGKPLETITFVPGSADPHGLIYADGVLYGSDAGYHPAWKTIEDSPHSGMIFRIDII